MRRLRRETVPAEPGIGAVGRIGSLRLEYVRQAGRTVFGRTACHTPWHLLPPAYVDDSGCAYTLLTNPSGGLVGGDELSIDVSVASQAHALLSTPSANRVYRALSQPALQEVTATVGRGGILEWVPEHTIPFAGSRFRQTIDVTLQPESMLVLWDSMASGRVARGERWAFALFENRIRIRTTTGMVSEQSALAPHLRGPDRLADRWDYVGSLFIVGDAIPGVEHSLAPGLADIVDRHHGPALGGVSRCAAPGLVVKILARSAPVLTGLFDELWGHVRRVLWRLPPAVLRKY